MVMASRAQSSLDFVDIAVSPYAAAVGGDAVTADFTDLAMTYHNPALLDSVVDKQFLVLYNPYLGDVQRFAVGYSLDEDRFRSLAFHLNFMDYGKISETDETGNVIGEYLAQQYHLKISKAFIQGPFSLGVAGSFALTNIGGQTQQAFLADVGGIYRHPEINWVVGMVFRNMGISFGGVQPPGFSREVFDVVLGSTIKPKYMPFRFTLTVAGLPNEMSEFEVRQRRLDFLERSMRYISVGTSLVLSNTIEFSIGYNHLRRQELRLESEAFGAGLSFGSLLRVKSFTIQITQMTFNAAGGSTFLSVQNDFNSLKKIF